MIVVRHAFPKFFLQFIITTMLSTPTKSNKRARTVGMNPLEGYKRTRFNDKDARDARSHQFETDAML